MKKSNIAKYRLIEYICNTFYIFSCADSVRTFNLIQNPLYFRLNYWQKLVVIVNLITYEGAASTEQLIMAICKIYNVIK